MRLHPRELDVFTRVLGSRIQRKSAGLYLFGSRIHDQKKGGDIDLLLLSEPDVIQSLREQKHFILAEFKKELGDQRIDLTLAEFPRGRKDPFLRHILKTAVLLKRWD